jgi:hypothetical protein
MKTVRRLVLLVISLSVLFVLRASAQIPDLEPKAPPGITPVPTVAFSFELTGANPEHYVLVVEAAGRAAYRSTGHQRADSPGSAPGDPYVVKFTMSQETRQEIFDFAARAHYFEKSVAYTKGRLANMGAKTLTYSDEKVFHQQTYNYSSMSPIQQLTEIFQNISTTLELGRRLEFSYKYEKLGVDEDLRNMDEAAKSNRLLEVQALAPLLKQIANDPSVLNIARERARKLLSAQ